MSTKAAVAEVRRFHQFIKAFEHIEAVAATIAQADQLVVEAEQRRHKIDAATSESTDRLGALERQIDQARAKQFELAATSEKEAERLLSEARAEADQMIDAAESKRDQMEREFQEIRKQHKVASDELEQMQRNHAKVSARLATLREEIQAFVGEAN